MTDQYLQTLWRQAVLITHGHRCVYCFATKEQNQIVEPLQCHHFVKRGFLPLRHDWRNGFPVHEFTCHPKAATKAGEHILIEYMGEEQFHYLCKMEQYITIKDYLFEKGLSRVEWEHIIAAELKGIIKNDNC